MTLFNGILKRRWVKISAMILGVLFAGWLLVSLAMGYHLTRRRFPRLPEPVPAIDWGTIKPGILTTLDGEQIGMWLIEGRADLPAIILLHGNGGRRSDCLDLAKVLAGEGMTVMLISLRAHGDSSGEINDIGYSARHDLIAGVAHLEKTFPNKPIFVLGRSLGGATAAFAGAELEHRVKGYILDSVYRDLRTAVRNRVEEQLPVGLSEVAFEGAGHTMMFSKHPETYRRLLLELILNPSVAKRGASTLPSTSR